MSNIFIKTFVRTLFHFTSRERALRQSASILEQYANLAVGLSNEAGLRRVEVPPMRGVDEDMRNWSFFMILEHNAIVNRTITATTTQLARGEALSGFAKINPKNDVMPSLAADKTQMASFADSVHDHMEAVRYLKKLRGTKSSPHPVFGNFDAHQWNCMFAFHMGLHLPQAKFVVDAVKVGEERLANTPVNGT